MNGPIYVTNGEMFCRRHSAGMALVHVNKRVHQALSYNYNAINIHLVNFLF